MSEDGRDVPTFAQAADAAGLPSKSTAAELLDKTIVVLDWEPATATVPETGKVTEGFQVTVHVVEEDKTVHFFCGQEALVKALKSVKPPFRTAIRKTGRTYIFT